MNVLFLSGLLRLSPRNDVLPVPSLRAMIVCLLFLSGICLKIEAQDAFKLRIPPFLVEGEDTLKVYVMNDIYVYPPRVSVGSSDDVKYRKMIRDVKKTLPYAKLIYTALIETYEYIMTLPEAERQNHLKRLENDLFAEYKPVLKKLTLTQGKLLIKLIDRECNQSSYDLLKAFLGPVRAGFWNIFAGVFGASLKSDWDPQGKDAATERIIELIEMGLL
jgi:hypothetical protein